MPLPTEKGIAPPPNDLELNDKKSWFKWFKLIFSNFPKVRTYTVTLDPASVAANTSAEQTFTVTGLSTNDVVIVSKPTLQAGLVIGNTRVSATDTLAITFGNLTGSGIDPSSEDYKIVAIRL